MTVFRAAALALMALAGGHANAQGTPFTELARFVVTDSLAGREFPLGRDLVLHLTGAWGAKRNAMGWDLKVVDRRIAESPNFFYECRCGHGPRPHDYYAWHFAQKYYPHERVLPVYGYPVEVRVRCVDCDVAGDSTDVHFVRGTVILDWRRLAVSNPRQVRGGD